MKKVKVKKYVKSTLKESEKKLFCPECTAYFDDWKALWRHKHEFKHYGRK